jgi:HD superfamily phosphohydrolase
MKKLNEEFEGRLSMAIDIFTGTHPKIFLTQLVSGQLDMDRLDYLKRDSFFTGVAEGVIGYDRIISMLNVVNNEIVVEEKGLYSIEKFLVARRLMYLQVYLHKAVISAEQMIRRVITLLPQHLETTQHIVPKALARLLTDENRMAATSEMMETFASLDDVEIDFTLKGLQHNENNVLRILSGGLIQRRLFRTVFSDHLFPLSEVQQTVADVANHLNLTKAEASQLVLTGRESVPTYDPSQGEIRILRKDGKVIDLPELLEDHAHPKTFNRYFLCYPVKA